LAAYPLGFFCDNYAHTVSQSGDCGGTTANATTEHSHVAI
jgi:hypothetical protein